MNDFHRDIFIGAFFVMGMFGYMSGEFILSSTLFAIASIVSNLKFKPVELTDEALCE